MWLKGWKDGERRLGKTWKIPTQPAPPLTLHFPLTLHLLSASILDPNNLLDSDRAAIEVSEEAEDNAEQPQELKKSGSFEGFDVRNEAHPIEKESDSWVLSSYNVSTSLRRIF